MKAGTLLGLIASISIAHKTIQCNEYLDVCTYPEENFRKVVQIKEGQVVDLLGFEIHEGYSRSITFSYSVVTLERQYQGL